MDEATRVGKNHVFLPSCQTNRVRVKYIYIYVADGCVERRYRVFARSRGGLEAVRGEEEEEEESKKERSIVKEWNKVEERKRGRSKEGQV